MTFYENFSDICKSKGLSPVTIALKIGSKNSHASWQKGTIPNTDTIIKLAKCLDCSTDKLLFGKDPEVAPEHKQMIDIYEQLSPDNKEIALGLIEAMYDVQVKQERRKNIKTIEIRHSIYKVSAGTGYRLENDDDWEDLIVVQTSEAEQADFAVTVDGDSMSPMFEEGDVVLVKQQESVEIGDICIYTINDEGFLKEFGGDRLISLNTKYNDIVPNEYDFVKCCGKVLGKAIIV